MDGRWLDGLEQEAERALPASVFRYFRQGARHGLSAGEAPAAWRAFRFAPHMLRDVTTVDTGVEVLGHRLTAPIAIAPTTLQRAAHPDGELAMARATAEAGSLMVVSSNAGTAFADLGRTEVRWWLQAYLPQDRSLAVDLLGSAVAAGASAVVLTLDTPVVGVKYDDGPSVWEEVDESLLRVNFPTEYAAAAGSAKATDIGEGDIDWLREQTGLPVVVKGVLRPDDARRCVQAGASAIWVSNHGGRQLDRAQPTAHTLASVVGAVGSEIEVYVDGGIRDGLDVLTALALGASCAFLGRLPLWALVQGQDGVRRMHRELADQLADGMRLAGITRVADAPGILSPDHRRGL